MIVPGRRQATKLAAEFHALDREIAELRTRASALVKQRDERAARLVAFARLHGDGETLACTLGTADQRFHFSIARKPGSVSYKAELLRFISADQLQAIVEAQPEKEDFQFAAFPK